VVPSGAGSGTELLVEVCEGSEVWASVEVEDAGWLEEEGKTG